MMIHSSVIEFNHLREAAALAGVSLERHDKSGSRSRDHKWDVIISGESGRRTNQRWGWDAGEYAWEAATWDQWGIFLAYLFEVDPKALTRGGGNYNGDKDFHRQTGNRFARECDGCDQDPWTKPVHYGSCPLAPENIAKTVHSQSSPDYKITAHRWAYDYEGSRPWSGQAVLKCKGHNPQRNMRGECEAVLVRG